MSPNKNNRQKLKGKEPTEAQREQKVKDKVAIGNLHTLTITKRKWTEFTNKKVRRNRQDQKTKSNPMLLPGDASKLQRQRQIQRERAENDSPRK